MVARGAGAAGPVLLACRHCDPLGLARRLPSLGVGAWRSAPLLPWRVQCPVRVCAALAAGSGGSGRYLVLCLPRFPLLAPRVLRCVWRAVPSGCPLPSLASTPFHAVYAFRELGPAALLVVPACPLCVCALALPRRPLSPPPPLGCVACAPCAVPALGAGRAVPRGPCPCACPAPVPRSVWGAWGGAAWSRFPPTWLGVVRPPRSGSAHPGRSGAGGWGRGGGGGRCAAPPVCATGGASGVGGRCASFRPSAFPGRATKRVSLASFWSWRAWPPYRSGSCLPAFSGGGLCGVLARWRGFACSPRFLWEPAAGAGGRPCSGPSHGRCGLAGGRGDHPLCLGGLRAGDPAACGPAGGVGGAGGLRRGPPAPPLGGGPRFPTLPPLSSSAHSAPACACGLGGGAASCTGCGLLGGAGGGGGGSARGPLPRGPLQTRDLPLPSPCGLHCGCHWRCSGHGGRGPHTVLVRRRVPPPGVVRAPLRRARAGSPIGRDPRGSRRLGALGRAVCWSSCVPPPPRVAGPSGGGGASPRLKGGWGVGAPAALKPGGGAGGGEGRGGRSAAPCPPAPSGVGLPSFVSGAP